MNNYKFYTSFETLPVYNYYKLVTCNDLRYLIKNIDYNNLPEIVNYNELQDIYNLLIKNIKKCDLQLTYLYGECLKKYIDYTLDNTKIQKCHDTFAKYLKYLVSNNKNIILNGIIYENLSDLYEKIKKELTYNDLIYDRLEIFSINNIYNKKNVQFDLYKAIIFISQILNITIDEFTCSTEKFNVLLETAEEKYKQLKDKKNGTI